jgi:hypothetical protein
LFVLGLQVFLAVVIAWFAIPIIGRERSVAKAVYGPLSQRYATSNNSRLHCGTVDQGDFDRFR